jgi:hypothetical protein
LHTRTGTRYGDASQSLGRTGNPTPIFAGALFQATIGARRTTVPAHAFAIHHAPPHDAFVSERREKSVGRATEGREGPDGRRAEAVV